MPKEIILPSLSAGMEDAVIARWLKAEGDQVAAGELLAEIETDKATMEFEAESAGRIGKIFVAEGERADVNEVLLVLLEEGEDMSSIQSPTTKPASIEKPVEAATGAATGTATAVVTPDLVETASVVGASGVGASGNKAGKIMASPLARRLAGLKNIDLASLSGSGPKGRIVRLDVERAAENATTGQIKATAVDANPGAGIAGIGAYETIPHTNMRRTIARRLLESKTTVPHFYLEADCDIEALLDLRGQINAQREATEKISVNDFVIKAVAYAMAKVPEVNAIWTDDAILRLKDVDISIAVATEGGLITPVLRNADQKSLGTVSSEMKMLAQRAKEGKLKPEEYQGGGFSISNLGMFGVKSFSAIINPPQSCILAVGAAERRPVGRGDQVVLAPVMSVTLSVDHRSVDGALGAQWLAAFKSAVEHPMSLLV